jgi:hypothetical protein
MKLVEHWRWRYRDAETGGTRRTSFQLTAEEAERRFPGAERIAGSMKQRDVDSQDFADTMPGALYRHGD